MRRGVVVHGVTDPLAYFDTMKDFRLNGYAQTITCPTLVTHAEGDAVVIACDSVLEFEGRAHGKPVMVNDTTSYDNGVEIVPTLLLEPVAIDKSNAKQVLVEANYYTKEQLGN